MCGLVGLRFRSDHTNAVEVAVNLLLRLQHRGQDGAGVCVVGENTQKLESVRGLGLVPTALKDWGTLPPAKVAVAHTRYATTGRGGIAEIQPFVKGTPRIALAHNGNIVNTAELRKKFEVKGESESDLEVLQQALLRSWHRGPEGFQSGVKTIFDNFNGGYAVVGVEEDKTIFAFRDPFGIRPLFYGLSDEIFVVASETTALTPFPNIRIHELAPGDWLKFDGTNLEIGHINSIKNPNNQKRFCMFEAVYFSSPQSELENSSVFRLRFQMGEELSKEIQSSLSEAPSTIYDYVVPVPETSRVAATAVAEKLGVPFREFLVKNPYVPRTFILATQSDRLKALKTKLSLIGPEIRGKRILLVDDSVVRGNTSRLMAEQLKSAGAISVSLASTCPPIRYGCYYGIDFPDPRELVASDNDVSQIAKSLGVDHLFYLSIDGLKKALGTSSLCMACLNGEYPTFDQSFEEFLSQRRRDRVHP